jgi:Flp pilus assembly protein TadB
VTGPLGALPILLAAVGGGLLAAAARDGLASLPALADWLNDAIEPLRRAGREGYLPTDSERRRLALLACFALPGVALLALGPGPAPLFALGGPLAAGWAVSVRRTRYRRRVEAQLGAVATAVADGLAAGRPARSALAVAAQPLDGPAAAEMSRVRADLELGVPTAKALTRLRARLDSAPVDSFCAAILTNHVAGGDLAGLLRRFAAAANERESIAREARGATAQARFTGLLVVAMPAGAGLLAELAHPGFLAATARSPAAVVMLAVAALLQVAGFLAIRRLGAVSP